MQDINKELEVQLSKHFHCDKHRVSHWRIENELHWFLDLVFYEDSSTTRKDNGAENLSTLRKLALQILRQTDDKHSIHHRRMKAARNQSYLLYVLQNAFNK